MSNQERAPTPDLRMKVLEILDANRIMSLATIRPDGWPQVTIVGYVHDGLTLYFASARSSQKLSNMARDSRISIAIGRHGPGESDIRGLSMAATATEVIDVREVARLNVLIAQRYPEQAVFAPRGASVAVMKAVPELISVIDPAGGLDQPALLRVALEASVSLVVPGDEPRLDPQKFSAS